MDDKFSSILLKKDQVEVEVEIGEEEEVVVVVSVAAEEEEVVVEEEGLEEEEVALEEDEEVVEEAASTKVQLPKELCKISRERKRPSMMMIKQ
mmetsp:Transcript_40437/g.65176  ORF Transcript_40437/g.65176 Transcript_40437/m.65176 type:complete len:93 (-) Transcript_40437:524-802(-)